MRRRTARNAEGLAAGGRGAGEGAGMDKCLNDYGEYVCQFAKNHGISTAEAHGHPMVKAYEEAAAHLRECRMLAQGNGFIPGA